MSYVEESKRCIKYLDRYVIEGRVITVEKFDVDHDHLATHLLVDHLDILLTIGVGVSLLNIHLNEAGADLTLLTTAGGDLTLIVGVDLSHLITDTYHTLDLVPLTIGPQMNATIEGVIGPTLHTAPGDFSFVSV